MFSVCESLVFHDILFKERYFHRLMSKSIWRTSKIILPEPLFRFETGYFSRERELRCEEEQKGRKEKLFSNYSTPKTSTRAVDKILPLRHAIISYIYICQGHFMEMFIKYDGLSCAKQKMAAGNSLWP